MLHFTFSIDTCTGKLRKQKNRAKPSSKATPESVPIAVKKKWFLDRFGHGGQWENLTFGKLPAGSNGCFPRHFHCCFFVEISSVCVAERRNGCRLKFFGRRTGGSILGKLEGHASASPRSLSVQRTMRFINKIFSCIVIKDEIRACFFLTRKERKGPTIVAF